MNISCNQKRGRNNSLRWTTCPSRASARWCVDGGPLVSWIYCAIFFCMNWPCRIRQKNCTWAVPCKNRFWCSREGFSKWWELENKTPTKSVWSAARRISAVPGAPCSRLDCGCACCRPRSPGWWARRSHPSPIFDILSSGRFWWFGHILITSELYQIKTTIWMLLRERLHTTTSLATRCTPNTLTHW